MQSRAIRERGVDEWLRDVNPATTVTQHSFDEGAKVVRGEFGGNSLVPTRTSNKHRTGLVDPDFLYRRVIEQWL
jgi:hypothetical protein